MFCTVRTFGKSIYNAEFTLKEANDDQGSYQLKSRILRKKTKPHDPEKK